jgi:hypothetical protein
MKSLSMSVCPNPDKIQINKIRLPYGPRVDSASNKNEYQESS